MQDQRETHKGQLHEQQFLYVVDDLCRFILHEVVHIDGYFVHPEHELSTESMNCQPTQNIEASVSGTISSSEPAIVPLV